MAAAVAVATTRNMIEIAERQGIIPDAEALWLRVVESVLRANPASVLTIINPAES